MDLGAITCGLRGKQQKFELLFGDTAIAETGGDIVLRKSAAKERMR